MQNLTIMSDSITIDIYKVYNRDLLKPGLQCDRQSVFREQMISHLAGAFANFGVDNVANFALLRWLRDLQQE